MIKSKIQGSVCSDQVGSLCSDRVGSVSGGQVGSIWTEFPIKGNVMANGNVGISLDRAELFNINENLIGGYDVGIQTTRTKANFSSMITENRFIVVETGVKFTDDLHNMLTVTCNDFRYRDKAIDSKNTDLMEQGTATLSAGNQFKRDATVTPINYIDHTGTATKYYFGPAEANKFSYPNVMNIPKIQAISDRVCKQVFANNCDMFIDVSVKEITNSQTQMTIFPNPSSGHFTVNYGLLPKGDWSLIVHDILGRRISQQKINYTLQTTSLEILSKGLYFVTLESKENRITQKVIVE